jgi:PLD-like domain
MIQVSAETKWYELPEDRNEARASFLALLHSPGETWISIYSLNMPALLEEIAIADAAGVPIHILLDHTQSCGHVEAPRIKALAASLQHSDLTVTTSQVGGNIFHEKTLITRAENGEAWCWTGSVNFSDVAFNEDNLAALFRSDAWANDMIERFNGQRVWSRAHEPQYQLDPVRAAG